MRFLKFLVKKFFPGRLLRKIRDKYFEIKGRKNERHYPGNAVLCPCCGKRFGGFMDFPASGGCNYERYIHTYKNTVCPYCFSMPRHRIVCYYLDKNRQSVPKDRILMLGAEFSIKKWFDMNGSRYLTADLFDRGADIKADIQDMPFPGDRWEIIICNHVLEHVPDYKAALKELKRVLNSRGFLEITVPADRGLETVYEDAGIVKQEDRIKYFGQYDHVRIFGSDFEGILRESGFLVEIIDGCKIPPEIGGVAGPMDYDDNRVYICRKKPL